MRTEHHLANLRWGVARGFAVASAYVAFVTVLLAVRGSEPFDRLQVSYPMVVFGYLCAGAVGGTVVGLLRPLAAKPLGARLVGALAGVLAVTPMGMILGGPPTRWNVFHVLVVLIVGVVMGTQVLAPELLKSSTRLSEES